LLRSLLPILFCAALPLAAAAQQALPLEEGSPFYLQAFAPEAYGAHGQNWEVVQDRRGLVYVANTHGVLEYDGRTWRRIGLPEADDQAVRSLALTRSGTVFVGGVGEVGYLAPDAAGQLGYASLLGHLREEDRGFADVWTTHALGDTVFFQSFDRLFRWDGRRMTAWASATRFHKAFAVEGALYVREEDVGLQRLEGDRLVLVPGGAQFAWESVYAVLPHPAGLLVGTRTQGLFLLNAAGARPYRTEADAYLGAYRPYNAVVLEGASGDAGRRYVVGTFGGGAVLLDAAGRLLRVYREDAGIAPDALVLDARLDRQGGLWLALNDGLLRVDVLTPLTRFGLAHGLRGTVYDVVRHGGALFAGTSTGLYRLVPGAPSLGGDGQPRYARFEPVAGIPEQVWALLPDAAGLLAATSDGVYLLREGGPQILRADKAFALYRSPSNPGRLFVGLKDGLAVLERAGGTWAEVHVVDALGGEVRSLEEDAGGRLWVALLSGGLRRLTWPAGPAAAPRIEAFGPAEGVPEGAHSVRALYGRVAVIAREGVFWVEDGPPPAFRRSDRMAAALAGREIVALSEGRDGRAWVYDGTTLAALTPEAGGRYRDTTPAALRFRGARYNAIYEEPDGTVWLGTEEGLLRYDPRMPKGYEAPYAVQLRAVRGRGGDLLFGGAFGGRHLAAVQADGDFLVLPYARNAVRFEYAAPAYNLPEGTEFQYLLEGFDDGWSAWSREGHTAYTNLPEHRHYRFRVRARNAQGVVSAEAVFAFRVLPPWYRTWWAYALYALAFGVALWGFSAWRLRAHREALEEQRMLNQRLDRMNARLAETNDRLRRADKLKDELLANTTHELRTPLTAILGFSGVLQDQGTPEQRELAYGIHRSGQRLLETVNGLLDMARLQADLLELRPAPVDVAEVARDVLAMLQPLAEERGLFLRLMPEGLTVPAVTDRYAVERVLINLASNALKFTKTGGITVLLDADDDVVRLTVRDTGIGIAPDFMPYLFDAFRQASTGFSRSHEGSGLGLAIVQRVVELLGGRIMVESKPGWGSTFAVVFPRHLTAGDGALVRVPVRPYSPVSEPVLDGARVLALAADPETQARLRVFIGDLCTLVVADHPPLLLREAKAVPFDVVLVERRAGEGEGACATLAAIRALPGYARIPVALLADGAAGEAPCAVQPDHVLALPLERGALLQLLEALLTRADGALAP
jgi:signal transduction histidine kinase